MRTEIGFKRQAKLKFSNFRGQRVRISVEPFIMSAWQTVCSLHKKYILMQTFNQQQTVMDAQPPPMKVVLIFFSMQSALS